MMAGHINNESVDLERSASQMDVDDIETFVIIHDQHLLLKYQQQGRFSSLRRLTYLFVGPRATDLLDDREDVIVARRLPDNIEQFPSLLSYTGWYSIARNKLAATRYVAVLEHDVTVSARFEDETLTALRGGHSIAGYLALGLTHPLYLQVTPWLARSLELAYGVDVRDMIRDHLRRGGTDQWTTSTNHAMRVDDLAGFVDWFLPVTEVFRHDPMGADVHERAIPVFCLLNRIEDRYLPGVLEHEQVASHGINRPPYESLERALAAQSVRAESLERDLAAQSVRAESLERAVAAQSVRAEEAEQLREVLLNSSSWRLTAPMRHIGRTMRLLRAWFSG
jgi:hypothetical protein